MRLLWYRFNHWLRHSPLVLLLGLLLGGLVLGLVTSSTTWPSTSDRAEVLTALGSIAALALLLLSTSLTRIMGQVAFASGLYSPRNAARLLARPLVIWSTGLFVAVIGCAGAAALVLLFRDSGDLTVLPVAVSAALFAISLLGFLAVNVDMTGTYRVSNVVGAVTRQGLREIDRLYPLTVAEVDEGRSRPVPPVGEPDQVVRAADSTFGVLLGFFEPWLVPLARTHNVTIVIVPAVGDFVEPGTPLFHVYGAGADPRADAPRGHQARTGENGRAGSALRAPPARRRGRTGPLPGSERPVHRRPVARPDRAAADRDRRARSWRGLAGRSLGRDSALVRNAGLGRLRAARLQRDPRFRCPGNAGRTSPAGRAPGSLRVGSKRPATRRSRLSFGYSKMLLRVHSPTRPSALRR